MVEKLEEVGREEGVTLFMVLLGACRWCWGDGQGSRMWRWGR